MVIIQNQTRHRQNLRPETKRDKKRNSLLHGQFLKDLEHSGEQLLTEEHVFPC